MKVDDIITIKEIKDIENEQNIISDLYLRGEMEKLEKYVKENILTKYVFEIIIHDKLNPTPARTYEDYFKSVYNFLESIKVIKKGEITKNAIDLRNEKNCK